jgi:histidinol-phosphatase
VTGLDDGIADLTRDSVQAELDLALELADECDALTLPLYEHRSFTLDWKENRTEVTEADRGAERMLADRLAGARPDHGVFGEEHGLAGREASPWRWVIDPIDGTSGFVRGIPVWATLLALTHAHHGVVVGVVSAPALGRRWWAGQGLGAFADGRPCRVSTVDQLADAQVSVTFSDGWDELGLTPQLTELLRGARRARGFGDFWQHTLVAEGAIDLAVDAVGVAAYDLAAVRVVVEEAGGTFTDRHGEPTHEHDTAISSNGLLHHEAVDRLGRP